MLNYQGGVIFGKAANSSSLMAETILGMMIMPLRLSQVHIKNILVVELKLSPTEAIFYSISSMRLKVCDKPEPHATSLSSFLEYGFALNYAASSDLPVGNRSYVRFFIWKFVLWSVFLL